MSEIPQDCPAHKLEIQFARIETRLEAMSGKIDDLRSCLRSSRVIYTSIGAVISALVSGIVFLLTKRC